MMRAMTLKEFRAAVEQQLTDVLKTGRDELVWQMLGEYSRSAPAIKARVSAELRSTIHTAPAEGSAA